jgi:hypothetical protein
MRITQQKRILTLLNSRPNQWVPLPDILDLHIAQYGTRIKELRADGFQIENKTEWINGARHSWFRLVPQERQLAFV